jgi:dihydropteroate synthase
LPLEDPLGPVLLIGDRVVALAEPLLMGVVNVNADSFSDGSTGRAASLDDVVARSVAMVEAGARILDVGGQSAVTNEPETDAAEELDLVLPVVERLRAALPETLLSVDSYKPPVVEAVLKAGVHIVNDVSGLQDPVLASLAVEHGAALVVMHTAAPPKVRLQDPRRYGSVVREVAAFLEERVEVALAAGLDERSVILDPGPDFTKTPWQTVQLLRDLPALNPRSLPLLLAISRKDFIGAINRVPPQERLAGTLAAVAAVGTVPGRILRVHDVAEVRRFLDVLAVLEGERDLAPDAALTDDIRYSRPR